MKRTKLLKQYIDHYKEKFGLDDCVIDVLISEDKQLFSDRNAKAITQNCDYSAEVTVKMMHSKEYTIVVNKHALHTDLKDTIAHEMLHILLWPAFTVIENVIDLLKVSDEVKVDLLNTLYDREHDIIDKLLRVLK